MAGDLQFEISYRQILRIALPISVALLVPQLNYVINNVFLGHLSEEALAVASITGVFYLIFAATGYGLNSGLQALISRRAGENRQEEIGKIFNQGIWVAMAIAVAGIIITFFIAPIILGATVKSPVVYEKAIHFLNIRILGLPFLYMFQMQNALLVSTNQSRYLIVGTLAGAFANIFFDYTLIFGKMGLPQLGFNGAAYASVIAEFIEMTVLYMVIRSKGIFTRFKINFKFNWIKSYVNSIADISVPLVFQHAISVISWMIFYILIERNSGSTGLAVSNTMRNIFGFFGVFMWAFASTTNAMVSNVIGQGRKDDVIPLIHKIIKLSSAIALIICIMLNIFPGTYLSIYGLSGEFIATGIPVLRVVTFALMFISFSTIWLNAVTGSGNSRVSFLIELSTIVIYCIYVFVVLEVYQLPLMVAWMSEYVYWSLLFIQSYLFMRSNKWRNKVI